MIRHVMKAALVAGLLGSGSVRAEAPPESLPPRAADELRQQLLPREARETELRVPHEIERVSLQDAVRRALARNPTALSAQAEVRRLIGAMEQARAASLPTLTATGSYTRLDADRVLGVGDMQRLVAGANQITGNLTVAMPLLAPGRWAQWLHANDNVRVGRIAQRDVQRQVAVATARAYLLVLAQTRMVDVAERARDTARAHHEFAQRRLQGGLGNRLDEARAQQEFQTAEAQLLAVQTSLLRAREALGVLAGSDGPLDCAIEPGAGSGPGPGGSEPAAMGREPAIASELGLELPARLDEAQGDAAVLRADLRLLQARAWATARLVRHSFTDYLPLLVGSFSPFYQNPPSIVQPLLGWQARIDLSWALFDGGARYGARHERQALYEQARLGVIAGQRQVRSEVRVTDEAMARSREALTAARRAAAAAAEALKLATLAYRAGATNNLEVIDAERRARDAAAASVQAEDQLRQAQLDVLIAAGRFPEPGSPGNAGNPGNPGNSENPVSPASQATGG